MPVEFIDKKKPSKRLRFIRNTAYAGADYGPDYPAQECDVDNASAFRFIAQDRAVEVKSAPPVDPTGQPQSRDPQPENRDPKLIPAPALPSDLHRLNKAQLLALAAEQGVGVTEHLTKAQIVEALEAAQPK